MTERERLIKLIEQCSCHYSPPCTGECGECHNVEMYDRNIEHIADHLLANGVIVPPCKVGDTVYVLSQGAGFSVVWNVYKSVVKAIHLDRWGQLFLHVETDKENIGGYVEVERVFLTREEAEKALAERSTDGKS